MPTNWKRIARTLIAIVATALVLLIGGIATLAWSSHKVHKQSLVDDTRMQLASIAQATVHFRMDNPHCPRDLAQLVAQKYLTKMLRDHWGKDFWLMCPGPSGADIDVVSAGPDGEFGTDDDVRSWRR